MDCELHDIKDSMDKRYSAIAYGELYRVVRAQRRDHGRWHQHPPLRAIGVILHTAHVGSTMTGIVKVKVKMSR
jgi:hypothetical protein